MHLSPDALESLRNALSAVFHADLACDEFDDRFLNAVAAAQRGYIKGTAAEWGWNDTEVRDAVCATAVELLGLTTPEEPSRPYRSVFTPGPATPQPDEAEWAAYYAAHDRFIEEARAAHAAWIRQHSAAR